MKEIIMNNEAFSIRILIINNSLSETENIKSWLEQDMVVPWTTVHCPTLAEVTQEISKSDVIILKPEMEDMTSPKEVFKTVEKMFFDIPIIVLANPEEERHEFSTYVMEQGAADIVIRGYFARLADAIEFSLIRRRLTIDARKKTDKTLSDNRENGIARLKESEDSRLSDHKKHKQILRMFSGDYTVDTQDK